jgi:hypothetical protein
MPNPPICQHGVERESFTFYLYPKKENGKHYIMRISNNLYSTKYCQGYHNKSDEWREVGSTHRDRNEIKVSNLFRNMKGRDHLETAK